MPRALKQGEPDDLVLDEDGWGYYFEECCDCGLVHFVTAEKTTNGVRFRTYRDEHATEQARKRRRKRKPQPGSGARLTPALIRRLAL